MTPDYVSFRWNNLGNMKQGITYDVWYDEGDSGRSINNFRVLVSGLNLNSYTYRNFTSKYAR